MNCCLTLLWPFMCHKSWYNRCKSPSVDQNCNVTVADTRIFLINWGALWWKRPVAADCYAIKGQISHQDKHDFLDESSANTPTFCLGDIYRQLIKSTFLLEHLHVVFTSPKSTVISKLVSMQTHKIESEIVLWNEIQNRT